VLGVARENECKEEEEVAAAEEKRIGKSKSKKVLFK
jgi:hypothetical protein